MNDVNPGWLGLVKVRYPYKNSWLKYAEMIFPQKKSENCPAESWDLNKPGYFEDPKTPKKKTPLLRKGSTWFNPP